MSDRQTSASEVITLRTRRGEIPLLFVEDDGAICVMPTPPGGQWAAEVLHDSGVEADPPGRRRGRYAAIRLLDEERAGRIRQAFRSKYGEGRYRRYFAGDPGIILLSPVASALAPPEGDSLEVEFDAVAESYDEVLRHKAFEGYLKRRARELLLDRFRGLDPLLEIGPGTGSETIPMLAAGHSVVGVDLSAKMLRQLEGRALMEGVSTRLTTLRGRLSALGEALQGFSPGSFAGAYSAFGAFNLEPITPEVARSIATALRPGGRLAYVALTRPSVAPFLWELTLANWRGAFARMGERIAPGTIRYPLPVLSPTAARLRAVFGPWFDPMPPRAISVLVPPFDSPRAERAMGPEGLGRAARLDRALCSAPGATTLAEWVLFDFRRNAIAST